MNRFTIAVNYSYILLVRLISSGHAETIFLQSQLSRRLCWLVVQYIGRPQTLLIEIQIRLPVGQIGHI